MKLFFYTIFTVLIATTNFARGKKEIPSEGLYICLARLFSGESDDNHEHRFNPWLGLSANLHADFHPSDIFGNNSNNFGPELGLFFHTHDEQSSHQFYIGPVLSATNGNLISHSNRIKRCTAQSHAIMGRLSLLSGYRYSFKIPLRIDVGLGLDTVAVVVPLNTTPAFLFLCPQCFIHFGLEYRF
jgi:hypothetical protein